MMRSLSPKRGGVVIVAVPQRMLLTFLHGVAPDPRVKHRTHVNAGKSYPYHSKRKGAEHAKAA